MLDEEAAGGTTFGGRGGLPGDDRQGSRKAIAAAAKACTRVSLGSESEAGTAAASSAVLYDCRGAAPALARLAA